MQTREFFIAGVQFHDLKKVINDLSVGDELEIVPEPENKFDFNAVAFKINGTMIGYVPKTLSAEISAAIEANGIDRVICEITELNPKEKPWQQCKVKVYAPDVEDVDPDEEEEREPYDEDCVGEYEARDDEDE